MGAALGAARISDANRSRCYAAELPSEVPAVWELRFDVHEDGYQYGFGVESDLEAEDKRGQIAVVGDFPILQ